MGHSSNYTTMKVFAILALAAVAAADKQPRYDEPAVYAFNYAVADDYSGAKFEAVENRDDMPPLDPTLLPFLMAEPRLSTTRLMMPTVDMLLMSSTLERPGMMSTSLPMDTKLPLPTSLHLSTMPPLSTNLPLSTTLPLYTSLLLLIMPKLHSSIFILFINKNEKKPPKKKKKKKKKK